MYSAGQGGHMASGNPDIRPPDARLRKMDDDPEREALFYLQWVARHLGAMPGHKTLIWVSSDNVLADWSSQTVAKEERGNKFIDELSLHARESLNEAHVSIYPLDASQLAGGGIGADIGTRNVLAIGKTDRDPATSGLGDSAPGIKPGRETARLNQDTHPIQPAFRELAEATGGRALRRASDIAAELDSIVNDGRAAYTLSFAPNTPADGTYHHLLVKAANRRDITLRYRTGYLYEKEPASLKERFQNAVWRPADLTEIALTAVPRLDLNSGAVKLNIAAIDLALAHQGGLWMDKLDIFLVQRDDALLHAKLDGQTLGLRLKPSTYQQILKDGISVDEPIKSVPANGALRFVVVDENTGRIGTLTLPASAFARKH